jgi:ferric enterobactin receptor
MWLVKKGKYISGKRLGNKFIHIVLFFFLFASLNGQSYRMIFGEVPLSQALVEASRQYSFKIAFDAEKLGSITVSGEITGTSVEEFIAKLIGSSDLELRFMHDSYLIVPKSETGKRLSSGRCQIIGSVSDRESGETLPFASVALYNNNMLASATESGSFSIRDVAANPVHMMISYIGYVPVDTNITWSDPQISLNIKMQRRIKMLDTIYVKGNTLEMVDLRNDVDFATTIDPVKLIDLPVLAETDIFRALQLLPGISYTENASGINIRGGSSDQNLVLFDGQTLYNLSHFYGAISSINPNVVKDLQIYKGGYDSRFGERVSGIIDITGKSGSQHKPSVYGDLNLLDANLAAEIPITQKLTLVAAVRRSYSDIYATEFSNELFTRNVSSIRRDTSTLVDQTKPRFRFYDYNGKLTYRLSNLESISVSVYGGKDYFVNSYGQNTRRFDLSSTDKNSWSNYGVSLTWQKQWNGVFYSGVQAGTSGYINDYTNSTLFENPSGGYSNIRKFLPDTVNLFRTTNRNTLSDYFVSMKNNLKLSGTNELNFGFVLRNNDIYYHKDADKIYVYDNYSQSAVTGALYFQDRIRVSDKFILKPGLRISFYSGQNRVYYEPRLSANYRLSELISFRVAAGRYYQFISQVLAQQETGYNKNFWVLADDKLHPSVSSDHLIAGFTAEKGKFLLDVEGYFKTFSGLQEYIYVSQYLRNSEFSHYFPREEEGGNTSDKPSYFITGTGKAYGIDVLLRFKSRLYTSWASVSIGRSLQRYPEINFNSAIPAPADQPYQLSWTNMFTAGRWNFGTVTLFSSGRPYIDFAHSTSEIPIQRTYRRLPDYFRSDLSANYNFTLGKAKFKAGATIFNLFNTQNYFDINNRKFDFDNLNFAESTLVRSQSISLNLFLHFIF